MRLAVHHLGQTRVCSVALAAVALLSGVPTLAAAQPPGAPGPAVTSRWELSGGGVFVGGYDLGERAAELTPNSGSASFEQFTTDNRVRPVFGLQARVGFVVTRALALEGGLRFSRPVFEVRVSGDTEDAPDTTIEETLTRYAFDGTAVWHFSRAAFGGGRAVPFAFGGAGYLRELHEDQALVEEGLEYHAGGGLKWWLGRGRRRVGVRAEAGFSIRDGGFDFTEGRRVVPMVGASLVYTF